MRLQTLYYVHVIGYPGTWGSAVRIEDTQEAAERAAIHARDYGYNVRTWVATEVLR